jgi:hypothetical protein
MKPLIEFTSAVLVVYQFARMSRHSKIIPSVSKSDFLPFFLA